MTTTSSIIKIGNSCGIIIPAKLMKSLSLSDKDKVIIAETGGRITVKKMPDEEPTPFSALDQWCEEHGYNTDESVEDSLEYIKSIRSERKDKEIPQW